MAPVWNFSPTVLIPRWGPAVLQATIAVGAVLELYERHWLNAAVATGILLLTFLPALLARRAGVHAPHEFKLLAIGFLFAALFLGELRDFYGRIWWWDLALHATSGGLLGVFGVLLVYVLNETPRISLHMKPGFVAFFAFCFAVSVGTCWEIFEFAMDRSFQLEMQKPMSGDPSGLTDTMWDLALDALGALVVSAAGYIYMKRGTESFAERWIRRFIDRNPRLFPRRSRQRAGTKPPDPR